VTGIAFSTIVAVGTNTSGTGIVSNPFWRLTLACVAAYFALVIGLASALRAKNRDTSLRSALATVNSLAAPFTWLGIAVVSSSTVLTVAADGTIHPYPWIATPLPIGLVLATELLVLRWLRRARADAGALSRVDGLAVLVSAAPVLVFVLSARLLGATDVGNLSVNGEQVVPATLFQQGWLPWRDILVIHGPLQDGLIPLLGMSVFGQSFWGNSAGFLIQVLPLGYVLIFALWVFLFRSNWAFLATATVLMAEGLMVLVHYRFVFWPLLLILFYLVLANRSRALSALLALLLVAQTILAPEAAYSALACGLVVFAFELTHVSRLHLSSFRLVLLGFSRTISLALAGGVGAVLFLAWLAVNHALAGWFSYLTSFVPDHAFLGGAPPMLWPTWEFPYMEFSVLIALVVTFFYATSHLVRRKQLSLAEWTMGVVAVLAFLYYPKFLDRMDWHVGEAYGMGEPLVFYVAFRLIGWVEERVQVRVAIANFWPGRALHLSVRHLVSIFLLGIVLVVPPFSPWKQLSLVATQYHVVVPSEPWLDRIGYSDQGQYDPSNPTAFSKDVYHDLSTALSAYLAPNDDLFDFTNAPGLYHFLLPYRPASSYYQMQEAYHQSSQQEVVHQLSITRPRLVVFATDRFGLGDWDGIPTSVREYYVAQYLLKNYRPLFALQGEVFYERDDLNLSPPTGYGLKDNPITEGLYFQSSTCNWGYSPEFLSIPSPSFVGSSAASVKIDHSSAGYWLSLSPGDRWSNYSWMEIKSSSSFGRDILSMRDDGSVGKRTITAFTLPGHGNTYKIPIGSCTQWWGYGASPLLLTSSGSDEIAGVTLSR
jgi:hypothetical protein